VEWAQRKYRGRQSRLMNGARLQGFMNLHQISVKPTALLKCGWIAEKVDKSRTILTHLVLLKKIFTQFNICEERLRRMDCHLVSCKKKYVHFDLGLVRKQIKIEDSSQT